MEKSVKDVIMCYKQRFLKHKQVTISDRKEQCFGDIMTPFSSSNALR